MRSTNRVLYFHPDDSLQHIFQMNVFMSYVILGDCTMVLQDVFPRMHKKAE